MLINLSNHPSEKWGKKQYEKAIQEYESVTDIPFPQINPEDDCSNISELVRQYLANCTAIFYEHKISDITQKKHAVHIMGELTFVYAFVNAAKLRKINCVASTTKRNIIEEQDGRKTVQFEFVKFRRYFLPEN